MDLQNDGEAPPAGEAAMAPPSLPGTTALMGQGTDKSNPGDLPEPPKKRGRPKAAAKDAKDGKEGDKGKKKKVRPCLACKRPTVDGGLWCLEDKRALDRIAFQAKQQGADTKRWFAELRKSEDKTVEMLSSYWQRLGGRAKYNAGLPSGLKWSFKEFSEKIRAQQGVEKTNRGKMMWEKEFVLFKQSVEGGRYGEEEAQLQWQQLVDRKAQGDPDLEWDLDGPRPDL